MSIVRSRRVGLAALSAVALVAVAVVGEGTARATANPTLWNQASASGLPAGSQIYDSVTLGGGVNPTGSVTFTLFGPGNPTCSGSPIFTATRPVNGNGYYESSRYTTNAAGNYNWMAVYSGDAANHPSAPTPCNLPSAEVAVAKRIPVLTATRSWTPPSASDTAVLSSGAGPAGPTGSMTFTLYGPANPTCAGPPITTSSRTVTGNGSYASALFTPTAPGIYQWVATYSGDADNLARSTICSDPANGFIVTSVSLTVVSGSPTTVSRGGTITVTWSAIASPTACDWVGLYPVGAPDGGRVTAWKYTTGAAGGSVRLKFPWAAPAGNYEIRLMANNTIIRLATGGPITVVWP
ncbi:MAG: hypothetical protein QOG43_2521 [Actinomycetota bacterium]|jgi:hypothetical protein|nr:hypothetical protein [Actinomycetota bacterium]